MKKIKTPKSRKTSWGPVAPWYDEMLGGSDTYQLKIVLPNLLRLLPPKGKRILDIACGQGFFSKMYADGGATVLGVDVSPELVAYAKSYEGKNLRFAVAPAEALTPATSGSFDGALIVLALQNIKEMPQALKEASRALVKGGTLVVVLNHPCFRILKASAWGYDETKGTQYRRIDAYGTPFSIKVDMTPSEELGNKKIHTVSFHRPLQDYFKALRVARFSVTGLEEWISHKQSERGPRAKAEDTARKEFPMFLTILARKD
ncbi:MAG: class I SAM-dependent methyltransferase [Patescibacteria group bacterium]